MMNTFITSLVFSSIEEMRPGLLPLIPPISQSEEESQWRGGGIILDDIINDPRAQMSQSKALRDVQLPDSYEH